MTGAHRSGRPVAIFDIGLPPGIAFIRSLGRAGAPVTAFAPSAGAAGRWSRFARSFRLCPPAANVDEFSGWLTEELVTGRIDLVAPTSDWIAFHSADAVSRAGGDTSWCPSLDAVLDCLLKSRFMGAMERAGFPTPAAACPATVEDALDAARHLGYPLVLKPRSHVGVGLGRGTVVRSDGELVDAFVPYDIGAGQTRVLHHDPDLALPLLQRYYDADDVELISVSGCLDADGDVMALGHSRKIHQWPPKLGVGTIFEALGPQPFTTSAVDAVRRVLGHGIFEIEVLVRRSDGDQFWAIDLNPRAFGQITLDIANGRDLPLLWYESVTGQRRSAPALPRRRPRRYWQQAVPYYAGAAVKLAFGPDRATHLRDVTSIAKAPTVGATRSWSDPLPGIVSALSFGRHPGGLFRPYLRDRDER